MAGDYKWQIKLCPRGSEMTKDASISMYLALDRSTPFPEGIGYGFPNFVSLDALNDNTKGFLLKDTCIIEAEVLVLGTVSKFP
ncbi:hypothetical protein IFM89_031532 [Coptis chinensis]|uniref:MATH domain-containing protein n=1 Tax=Coptis chinensis TaxID=261450 RepID=A0A835IHJ0_9MAGN|nr:hypothetical protein IFM89_031532 [Coptis chinensis]